MGKCHSIRRKRRVPIYYHIKGREYNWVTDHRQLTHREKCDLLFFIRDGPEKEVIQYFEENLYLLSCLFWFEIFSSNTDKTMTCSCSKDLELCYASNIEKDEIVKRLEIAITSAACPHVIFFKNGIDVSFDQDIASSEIKGKCSIIVPEVAHRNHLKQTAGVYWIHLAVIYRKFEIVRHILPLAVENTIADHLYSEKHLFSPISVAIGLRNIDMALLIIKYHESFLFRSAVKLEYPSWYSPKPINMALWFNEYEAFKAIYDKVFANDLKTAYYVDTFDFWVDKIVDLMNNDRINEAGILLTVRIGVMAFIQLFKKIHMTDSYWMCKKIFAIIDFRKEQRTTDKYLKQLLDEVLIRAVFTGDPQIVQTLLDNGFNASAKYQSITALAFSNEFSYTEVSAVLKLAKVSESSPPKIESVIKALAFDKKPETDFTLTFDAMPLIHRLFDVGHYDHLDTDVLLKEVWLNRFGNKEESEDVFHYLLLRGCDPSFVAYHLSKQCSYIWRDNTFLFHLITANSFIDILKVVKLYASYCCEDHDHCGLRIHVNDDSFKFEIQRELVLSSSDVSDFERTNYKSSSNDILTFISGWIRSTEQPKTLKLLCRRKLRVHFRGLNFYRFLQCKKKLIPGPILDYLLMSEYLHELFKQDNEKLQNLLESAKKVRTMFNIENL